MTNDQPKCLKISSCRLAAYALLVIWVGDFCAQHVTGSQWRGIMGQARIN